MDRKKISLILLIIFSLLLIKTCSRKIKDKGPIIQECRIENDIALIIINKNRIKYNEINYVVVGALLHPETVQETEEQLIITAQTENIVEYQQGNVYEIEVYWFGGHIIARGIYRSNYFEIIDEWVSLP